MALFGFLVLFEPIIDPFLYFFFPISITLLNFSFELVGTSLDIEEIVVSEISPFLFQFTELSPSAGLRNDGQ